MGSTPLASEKTGEEAIKWSAFCCYGKPHSIKKKIKIMQESSEGSEDKGEPLLSSRYVGISWFP